MSREATTAWVGWVFFAAMMILVSGVFNIMAGIAALYGPDSAYLDTGAELILLDVESWGWAHLILGILMVFVGACLAAGQMWARAAAVFLVVINLVTQFVWLPFQPWWSVIVIVVDLVVLWAVIVHGDEADRI